MKKIMNKVKKKYRKVYLLKKKLLPRTLRTLVKKVKT